MLKYSFQYLSTAEEAGYESSGNYQVGDDVWIEYHILKVNLQRKVKENEKLVTLANHIVRGFVKKVINQSNSQLISLSVSQAVNQPIMRASSLVEK